MARTKADGKPNEKPKAKERVKGEALPPLLLTTLLIRRKSLVNSTCWGSVSSARSVHGSMLLPMPLLPQMLLPKRKAKRGPSPEARKAAPPLLLVFLSQCFWLLPSVVLQVCFLLQCLVSSSRTPFSVVTSSSIVSLTTSQPCASL